MSIIINLKKRIKAQTDYSLFFFRFIVLPYFSSCAIQSSKVIQFSDWIDWIFTFIYFNVIFLAFRNSKSDPFPGQILHCTIVSYYYFPRNCLDFTFLTILDYTAFVAWNLVNRFNRFVFNIFFKNDSYKPEWMINDITNNS
jgi:hypothetical protein